MSDPNEIDHEAARKAYDLVSPRLVALPADSLANVSTDVQKASIAAAQVGRFVKQAEARTRFAKLPGPNDGGLDQAHVDDLETIALACWHASVELLSASAGSTEAKLPAGLVEQAITIRKRMLDLLEYHYGSDPVDGPEIADIKRGTGYADLASDLLRLVKLYLKYADYVKLDPKNYVESDVTDAGKLAHQIITLLGEAKKQDEKAWTDRVCRAWTLLTTVYEEVAVPGRWLYRRDRPEERFPSLYAAGRSTPGRRKKPAAQENKPAGPAGTGTT